MLFPLCATADGSILQLPWDIAAIAMGNKKPVGAKNQSCSKFTLNTSLSQLGVKYFGVVSEFI